MTFGEATEHLDKKNEALIGGWSILVRKLKHKVQKPFIREIAVSEYSYNCGEQTLPIATDWTVIFDFRRMLNLPPLLRLIFLLFLYF